LNRERGRVDRAYAPDMSGFAVTLSSVQQTASTTASAGLDLGDELTRLRREADAVLSGGWSGAAAAAFDRSWCEWDAAARLVVDALDRLAELLAASGDAYGACDGRSSDELIRAVS
jgi:WXG100 family type VII secretion target